MTTTLQEQEKAKDGSVDAMIERLRGHLACLGGGEFDIDCEEVTGGSERERWNEFFLMNGAGERICDTMNTGTAEIHDDRHEGPAVPEGSAWNETGRKQMEAVAVMLNAAPALFDHISELEAHVAELREVVIDARDELRRVSDDLSKFAIVPVPVRARHEQLLEKCTVAFSRTPAQSLADIEARVRAETIDECAGKIERGVSMFGNSLRGRWSQQAATAIRDLAKEG